MAKKVISDGITLNTSNGNLTVAGGGTVYRSTVEKITGAGSVKTALIKSNATYYGSAAADVVKYYNGNVKIYGQGGNDSIVTAVGTTYKVTLSGGNGNDTIASNTPNYGSISGGNGNDVISLLGGTYTTIQGGAGNDNATLMAIYSSKASLGSGNDTVTLTDCDPYWSNTEAVHTRGTSRNRVDLGTGNDKVTIAGTAMNTVLGGDGNDSFYTRNTASLRAYGGEGNDTMNGYDVLKSRLDLGAGTDEITLTGGSLGGTKNTVIAGDGNDRIVLNNEASVKAYGGDGADIIIGNSVVRGRIEGDTGNDKITVSGGERNTVLSGEDADRVFLKDSVRDNIMTDTGADTVIGSNSTRDTIKTEAGADRVSIAGSSYSKIYSGTGNDRVTLTSGDKDYVSLYDGADYLYGSSLTGSTIYGGNGADTIRLNNSQSNRIYGGTGSDKITVTGGKNTISAGTGNDIVSVAGGNNQIIYSGGNDTVLGSGSNDSLWIYTGISVSSMAADSNDLVITTNKGTVRVNNAKKNNVVLMDSTKKVIDYSYLFIGSDGNDFIQISKSNISINSGAGNDTIKTTTSVEYDTIVGSGTKDIIDLTGNHNKVSIGGGIIDIAGNSNTIDFTNESIVDIEGSANTVNGSSNDDLIAVSGNSNVINAGAGNDYVEQDTAGTNTVYGGFGNDTMAFAGELDSGTYVYSGGYDVITGFTANDTVVLGDNVGFYSLGFKAENNTYLITQYTVGDKTVNGMIKFENTSDLNIKRKDDLTGELGSVTPIIANTVSVGTDGNDVLFVPKTDTDTAVVESYAKGGNDLVILSGDRSDSVLWQVGDGNDTVVGFDNQTATNTNKLDLYFGKITGTGESSYVYTQYDNYDIQKIVVGDDDTTVYVGDGQTYETLTLLGVGAGDNVALDVHGNNPAFSSGTYTFANTGTYTGKQDNGVTFTAK